MREALDFTQKLAGKPSKNDAPRHVSGQQLLEGIRDYALQEYGPMSLMVLALRIGTGSGLAARLP